MQSEKGWKPISFFSGGGVEEIIGWASDKGGFFYGTEESVSQGDILDTSLNPYTVFHLRVPTVDEYTCSSGH